MPGPLQYGNGIKALTIDLLVAQMLSLRRCAELEHAITGLKISEATFLSYIERINDSLQPKFSSWSKTELWQVIDVEPMPVFGKFYKG